IKTSPQKNKNHIKNHLIPISSVFIIKSELLFGMSKFSNSNSIHGNICNSLEMLSLASDESDILYLKDAFASNVSSERLETQLQDSLKNGKEFEKTLSYVESILLSGNRSSQLDKTTFCLIHNIILLLLKNKKTDELLSFEQKNIIQKQIVNIINLLGLKSINSYSAINYNHVHKVGYLKILGMAAERDLCYVEDVDTKYKRLKFKIASQLDTLPRLLLNKKDTLPLSIKVKELTIFDLPFSYEIYFWLTYLDESHEFYIHNKFKTEIMVNGKRQPKSSIKEILNSHLLKNKAPKVLPYKAKWLRHVASLKLIKINFKDSWIFIDNEIRADDNAEHFYRYVAKNHPNVNSFFLISKNSPDWTRLKKEGFNLIEFGGLKHRLALLNAKYLLSSHANPAIVNYLPRKHYSDIMNYKFVFLQHGITKDDQSEWLNSRKIDYLVTAARHEFNDISGRGRYRFTSQEMVLTGFPRYDNLVKSNESKKQILIMPTWRKSLAGELIKKSSKRIKNPEFINSLFCEMWGGFLCSETLRKIAEDNGYSIHFLPHPNLTDYLEDLALPDYIQVSDLTSCSIQATFKDADVLITDYSSVAFDVAYMKKPIIYFQFDSDTFFSDHSYSKGYYDYEELGFGPVVSDIDRLNTELNNILINQCKLTPYYNNRTSNFFQYNDHENSSRLFKRLNNDGIKSHDSKTIIDYLTHYVSNVDLNAVNDILGRFETNLREAPKWLHEQLIKLLDDIVFFGKLDDNESILIKVENIYKAIDPVNNVNLSINMKLAVAHDVNPLLKMVSNYLLITNKDKIQVNISNVEFKNYHQTLYHFLYLYNEQNYQDALAFYDSQLAVKAVTMPRNILLLRCLALIKHNDILTSLKLLPLLNLSPEEKDTILSELYDHHQPENIYNLKLNALLPIKDNSLTAIEAIILLSKTIPEGLLTHFSEDNVMPDSILTHYINRLFKEKKYISIDSILSERTNKIRYVVSDANRAKYLFTVFISNGIEKFLA
ncbi:MAG: CDP-glycerol glycerophosphotransferase family protein, partial [Staphylococcus sp.]|nr:CDP-glycerol glycerophosphotransferase family protein [Staphylococcus sp.]